jgi:hypothetical protein
VTPFGGIMPNAGFAEFINYEHGVIDLSDPKNFVKIPDGKIPIFGNQFLPDEQKDCCKIYTFDKEHYLLKNSFSRLAESDFLDTKKVDNIYRSLFDLMIK